MPTIRVTPGIVRDYDDRGLIHAPYDRITKAGEYEVAPHELRELLSDAEYQGDVGGCSGIEHPAWIKSMYRRFWQHLSRVADSQVEP